jgi:uncharacterized repeat protein (TIGR03803 family)
MYGLTAAIGPGRTPYAQLALGIDGNYYGTTYSGGRNNEGAIFSFNPITSGSILTSFNGTNGETPYGWLLRSKDGNSFYGTATNGGSNGYGTVFQYFPPNVTACVGQPFSYPIIATSVAPVSYTGTGLPPGISLNGTTGVVSGTATTSGTYNATINASNAGGTASMNLNIMVVAGAPAITSTPAAQAGQGVAFSYQAAASNIPTGYSATGLPAGFSINPTTGLIIGTPASTGNYNVTISASNADGSGTEQLTISVVTQPSITSSLSMSGTQNSAFTYQIAATYGPSGFGATGLPPDLSVDPVAGMISGTPSETGTYNVTLSATNAAGTGTAAMTLVLQPASVEVPLLPPWALVALPLLLLFVGGVFLRRKGERT